MLPPLASLTDFTDRLGLSLTGVDQTRAEAALRDASAVVRTEAGVNWVDAEGDLDDVPEVIATVVLAVARRVWDNPSGKTSTTEGLGQHSQSDTWANPTADVYLKASERALIRSVVDGESGGFTGLWSLSTTRSDNGLPDRYLEVGGSELIPHVPADEVNW